MVRFLSTAVVTSLVLAIPFAGIDNANAQVPPNDDREKALTGKWEVAGEIQKVFDTMSTSPDGVVGELGDFVVIFYDQPTFWNSNDIKPVEEQIKKLAADRKHTIVATGQLGGNVPDKPLSYITAFFLLTEKRGQTYFSVIAYDPTDLQSWPVHHIDGKKQEDDLLIVEFALELGTDSARQIRAFRRATDGPP